MNCIRSKKCFSFGRALYCSQSAPSTANPEKDLPAIARKFPMRVTLEKDKLYSWYSLVLSILLTIRCTCGLSTKQPFCDGKHKAANGLRSLKFSVPQTTKKFLCMCKQTKNPPYASFPIRMNEKKPLLPHI